MFPSTKAFRILYNTLYYALYLILLGVLIVSPADLMRQAVMHRNNTNVLIIAASYLVTILVLLVIYFGRLYINRSVLASIPKGWIPVDKSDGVPRKMREVIVRGFSRNAAIAFGARPRVEIQLGGSRTGTGGVGVAPTGSRGTTTTTTHAGVVYKEKNTKGLAVVVDSEKAKKRPHHRIISKLRTASCTGGGGGAPAHVTEKDSDIATAAAVASVGVLPPKDPGSPPVWGEIEHPGWASPTSPDLPNLQYMAVISELPNLIEAKALTLAPLDPESQTDPPALDPDAVAVLQRPEMMGLREYLVQLTEIEVLAPAVVGPFISQYEAAKYSIRPVSEKQFRQLMHLFAEVLRGMQPLDPAVLLEEYDDEDEEDGDYASAIYDSDIDNDAPRGSSSSSLGEEENQPTNNNNYTLNDNTFNNTGTTNNLLITRQKSSSSRTNSSADNDNDSMSSQRRYSNRNSNLGVPPGPASGRNTPLSIMRNSSANTWQHSQSHSLSQTFRTAPTTPKSRRTVRTFEDYGDGDGGAAGQSRRRRSSFSERSRRTGSTGTGGFKRKSPKSDSPGSSRDRKSLGSPRSLGTGTGSNRRQNRVSTTGVGMNGAGDGNGEDIEMDTFAQTRNPYVLGESSGSGSGSASMRSGQSGNSGSSGSGSVVIRLASNEEENSRGLPYILGLGELGRSVST